MSSLAGHIGAVNNEMLYYIPTHSPATQIAGNFRISLTCSSQKFVWYNNNNNNNNLICIAQVPFKYAHMRITII